MSPARTRGTRSSRPWDLPDREATDEASWLDRRQLVAALGAGTIFAGCAPARPSLPGRRLRARIHPGWPPDREPTDPDHALGYNNYYEVSTDKRAVAGLIADVSLEPWSIEVTGRVHRPTTWSLDDLLALDLEERTYRFRCVEAWSMTLPWIGVPLATVLEAAAPLGDARWVRFVSMSLPTGLPGRRSQPHLPWPYHEALRMDEAMHPLTLLAVGMYGRPLAPQNGAPARLVVPWKYGFKSAKAIRRIEVLDRPPPTFWNTLVPDEYDLLANVRPDVPHPRWSQATERVVPAGERIPTLPFNGYGPWVADLYRSPT